MIVSAGLPFKSPVAPTKRNDDVVKDKSDTTDKPADAAAARFAALMALLGGANSKVRTDLLKQVPASDSSLLDKLLSGAAAGDSDATTAADAARYGMLLGTASPDANALTAGIPAASTSTGISRISAEVLARIASRKSTSVENLLAMGDKDAAALKAQLNALLATAGTPDAAALAAVSAANPTTPQTATDGLDPEFRAKLNAVIARMNEAGSNVSIVETVRSQDRQDMLFAQGRTTPGNVVTWTQDSAHKQGRAADVIVDGSWNNPKGFALLQQIAKEEGLKTLGAADPGHLELAADSSTKLASAKANELATASSGIARVASVATVASVASMGSATVTSAKTTPTATTTNAPVGLMAQASKTATDARATSQDSSGEKSPRDKPSNSPISTRPDAALSELGRSASQPFVGPVDTVAPSAPTAGVTGAERVQKIDDLQSQTSNGPVSQMTLEVDGINGDKQQITVDMRGNTVGANITTDAASADRMRARVGDLQSSLESHGLEVDTVRISSPRATESTESVKQVSSGDALRMGGSASTNNGDGNFQQGARDRSSATRDWEDRQAAREEQRRSGKQQQQQDRQRPQYQEKQ
jgi:hypothetical protein